MVPGAAAQESEGIVNDNGQHRLELREGPPCEADIVDVLDALRSEQSTARLQDALLSRLLNVRAAQERERQRFFMRFEAGF